MWSRKMPTQRMMGNGCWCLATTQTWLLWGLTVATGKTPRLRDGQEEWGQALAGCGVGKVIVNSRDKGSADVLSSCSSPRTGFGIFLPEPSRPDVIGAKDPDSLSRWWIWVNNLRIWNQRRITTPTVSCIFLTSTQVVSLLSPLRHARER
jgi:hypothetical protein